LKESNEELQEALKARATLQPESSSVAPSSSAAAGDFPYKTICSDLKEIKNTVTEIKNEIQHHSEEQIIDVDKLIESQNGVVDSVNHLAEEQRDVQNILKNQTQQMSQQVAHSEHISYKVRGQLGAQERKRRKVDLEEIGRLRTDLGVMKRQLRDKDNVVAALGEHVASLDGRVASLDERVASIDEKMQTLIDLVRIIADHCN
jgi:predicted phage tail protein